MKTFSKFRRALSQKLATVGGSIRSFFHGALCGVSRLFDYLGEYRVSSLSRAYRRLMRSEWTYCYEQQLAIWPTCIWDSKNRLLYLQWFHWVAAWSVEWPEPESFEIDLPEVPLAPPGAGREIVWHFRQRNDNEPDEEPRWAGARDEGF